MEANETGSPVQIPRRKRTTVEARARERRLRRLVDFGNKVKLRFRLRPDVVAAFWETCRLCEEKGEEWVFGKLCDLFADHHDLVADFAALRSEGSATIGGGEGRLGDELAVLNTREKPEINEGEPKRSFPAPVKSAHERVLFDCEDDMCDLDVTIGLIQSAMSRIGSHLAAGRRDGCRLTAGELRCIRRMYGDQGADMEELLRDDPARTLPLVLSRLQQKQDQWIAYRSDARGVWKKAFAEHHQPSLGRGDTSTSTSTSASASTSTSTITAEAPVDTGGSAPCPPAEPRPEAPEKVNASVPLNLLGRRHCRPMRLVIRKFYEIL